MILKTPDGNEFEAYLSGPDDAKRAVLIVHDWWGVLDYNKQWADRFAAEGYKAMVIDLYDGERARSPEEAGEMMRALDQDQADSKLIAATEFLKQGGRKVASLGWSLGGRQAMQAALLDPEAVRAAVLFYCRMLTDVSQLEQLGGPVFAIYAKSEQTWPAKMEKFNAAMDSAGKSVETLCYDAAHGFANPTSERYNAELAEDAWHQVRAFLERALA
jgi:carboxymethylenebutenolidase